MAGNIVVDGVVASCYASGDHDLIHIVMAPFLKFPETIEAFFGKDREFSTYVKTWQKLGRVILPTIL